MPQSSLRLLGAFQLSRGEEPAAFRTEKERALLAYLAGEASRPHTREALAGLLWPELPDETAHNNLRVTLHRLRQALGDAQAAQPLLEVSREAIQLDRNGQLWIDVVAFERLLSQAEGHLHEKLSTCAQCMAWFAKAAALYQGEFLQGLYPTDSLPFAEWGLLKREHLHRKALQALYLLAAYHRRRGELDLAYGYAQRQLELEPWREEAHSQMMIVLALRGEQSAALRQYERCCQVLVEELGVEPSDETRALSERILASRQRRLHNLPRPPTPFLGRKAELSQLSDYMADPDCRLLTILGPGGIGKSRLALRLAEDQLYTYLNGAFLIKLAAVTSEEGIVTSIANTLEFNFQPPRDPKSQLLSYLHKKELLLVLDDYEHLLGSTEFPSGVGIIQDLLENVPSVHLLVTSRQRLNLSQEWVFSLRGLSYPPDVSEADLGMFEAVQLFLHSARRIDPSFHIVGDTAAPVVRICQLLEGVPLAIELASAWIRVMDPHQIAAEIERGLDFLARDHRDVSRRHHSLRAVFEHSWRLLATNERRVFPQLSIFKGGFTRQAAFAVTGASLNDLKGLIDNSLLALDGSGHYRAHELLRKYGEEQLVNAGEQEQVKDRHLRFYLDWVKSRENLFTGKQQVIWMQTLEEEYGNFQAALEWALNEKARPDLGLSLTASLGRYWLFHGYWREGQDWFKSALALVPPNNNLDVRFQAIYWLALITIQCGELDEATDLVMEGMQYLQAPNDPNNEAYCLDILGLAARQRGNYKEATRLSQRSLELFRAGGNQWGCTQALNNLFRIAYRRNDYRMAEDYARQSLELSKDLGDIWHIAMTLVFLGILAHDRGDLKAAEEFLLDSQKAAKQLKSPLLIAHARYWLARVKSASLQIEEAEELFTDCLEIYRDLGNRWGVSVALHGLSQCALFRKLHTRAYHYVIEAVELQRQIGDHQLVAFFQNTLGEIYLAQNALDQAEQSYMLSLEALCQLEDWGTLLNPLRGLVKLYSLKHVDELAARLAGMEAGVRDGLRIALSRLDSLGYFPAVQVVQERLDPQRFEQLYENGRELLPKEVLDLLKLDPEFVSTSRSTLI